MCQRSVSDDLLEQVHANCKIGKGYYQRHLPWGLTRAWWFLADFQSQVARHREAQTLVPRQLTVPDAERIARKKKRRRRRWERQQRAAAQPVRFLEGYAAVPHPVAMLAPSFASKTGTDSYDDEEDYILDEESSSGMCWLCTLLRAKLVAHCCKVLFLNLILWRAILSFADLHHMLCHA